MVSHQLIGLGNWLHLCTCESMYVFFHIHVCVQSFCVCAYFIPRYLKRTFVCIHGDVPEQHGKLNIPLLSRCRPFGKLWFQCVSLISNSCHAEICSEGRLSLM